jgi:hypothetical protein
VIEIDLERIESSEDRPGQIGFVLLSKDFQFAGLPKFVFGGAWWGLAEHEHVHDRTLTKI